MMQVDQLLQDFLLLFLLLILILVFALLFISHSILLSSMSTLENPVELANIILELIT